MGKRGLALTALFLASASSAFYQFDTGTVLGTVLDATQSPVQVTAEVPLLQADISDRGQTIAAAQIKDLPLAARTYSEQIYFSSGILRTESSRRNGSNYSSGWKRLTCSTGPTSVRRMRTIQA